METVSTKIKGIIGSLATEVNDYNKEYANEKISAKEKKDQINSSIGVAQYRANNAVKTAVFDILTKLKEERVQPAVYERVKQLFNERL